MLENAADLARARQVYDEAYDFCVANGSPATAQVCLVCLAYILWETGRWDEAEALERQILASPDTPAGVRAAAHPRSPSSRRRAGGRGARAGSSSRE